MDGEVIGEIVQEAEEEAARLAEVLGSISARIEVDAEYDFENVDAPEMMKLRGALYAGQEMMTAGMADLIKAGVDKDQRLQFVLGVWQLGAEAAVIQTIAKVEAWLEERDLPVVSLYPVRSSNIAAMGWRGDPGSEPVAVVEFRHGGLYEYQGVTQSVFQEWWDAPSQGVYLAQEIKGVFEFRRL